MNLGYILVQVCWLGGVMSSSLGGRFLAHFIIEAPVLKRSMLNKLLFKKEA